MTQKTIITVRVGSYSLSNQVTVWFFRSLFVLNNSDVADMQI